MSEIIKTIFHPIAFDIISGSTTPPPPPPPPVISDRIVDNFGNFFITDTGELIIPNV